MSEGILATPEQAAPVSARLHFAPIALDPNRIQIGRLAGLEEISREEIFLESTMREADWDFTAMSHRRWDKKAHRDCWAEA